MTATAADVGDCSKAGKVVGPQNAGNLSHCLPHHRLVEKTRRRRILAQVLPITAWDDSVFERILPSSRNRRSIQILASRQANQSSGRTISSIADDSIAASEMRACGPTRHHEPQESLSRKHAQRARQRSCICSASWSSRRSRNRGHRPYRSRAAQPGRAARRLARRAANQLAAGTMFWFIRNTLSGSYFTFNVASLASFAAPYAAVRRSGPSSEPR